MTSVMPNVLQEQTSKETELQNKKRDRLQRLAQVFSRANSVLTSRPIAVHVVNEPRKNAPAWSSASDVWFNLDKVRDEFDAQSLLSLQGLNFHELAHVRYTPRNGSEICRWVIENDKWQAFNCLEDMRIEGLLVSRFPSIANWLTATVLDYLVREPEALGTLFALVRGRRYLPVELRKMARENYLRQEDIDELCDVVDSYRTLLFPEDTEVAKELITRYHDLLQNLPIIEQPTGSGTGTGGDDEGTVIVQVRIHDPHGHATRPTQGVESSNSRPASKDEQRQDRDNLKKQDKQDEAEVSKKPDVVIDVHVDSTPQDTTDTDTTSNQPSKEKSDTPDVTDNFDDVDVDDDYDFDDYNDTPTPPKDNGNSWGTGSEGDDNKPDAINEQINDLLDEIVDELSKELDRLSIQVNGSPLLEGNNTKTPQQIDYTPKPVPQDLFLVSKAFARELERLRAKHDPAWDKYVDSGRFNVNRYLNGDEFDTLFDEWSEGRDDVTAIEAVICLDYSGSMEGANATSAYQSMWAIKKALEQVNARTTVVLFDDRSPRLLYGANDKAGTVIRDAGTAYGTDPTDALLYSQNVLATTEQPIRLLFMITDGIWQSKVAEESVREMKRAGVVTCQALIADYELPKEYLNENRHEFELVSHVRSAKDVLSLGKDLVRLSIARQLVTN
jgi:hypothetical protein